MTAIIFDFDQTLVFSQLGFNKAEEDVQKVLYPLTIDNAILTFQEFQEQYWKLREEFMSKQNHNRRDWWSALLGYYGIQVGDSFFLQAENKYWDMVEEHSILFQETIQTLHSLRERGIWKMGIISDTDGQVGRKMQRIHHFPELTAFYKSIIVAGEGIPCKPDPAPFKKCVQELKVGGGEKVYFVGDNYRVDVVGSQSAGLTPVWLRHPWVRELDKNLDTKETDILVLTSLDQLITLI